MRTTAPGYGPDLCSKVPFRGPAVSGITISMAMTLRLDDQETAALRERAQLEGRYPPECGNLCTRESAEQDHNLDMFQTMVRRLSNDENGCRQAAESMTPVLLIAGHCCHPRRRRGFTAGGSRRGTARFMNSSNRGTVKAAKPWEGE